MRLGRGSREREGRVAAGSRGGGRGSSPLAQSSSPAALGSPVPAGSQPYRGGRSRRGFARQRAARECRPVAASRALGRVAPRGGSSE